MHDTLDVSMHVCRFPATFTFVLRDISTLEGIGRTLDKDYKFVAVAQPYAQQLLNLQVWPVFSLQMCSCSPRVPAQVPYDQRSVPVLCLACCRFLLLSPESLSTDESTGFVLGLSFSLHHKQQ